MTECKKQFCHNEAARGQVFCCKDHAPCGYLSGREPGTWNEIKKQREKRWAEMRKRVEEMCRAGKTVGEVSHEIQLSLTTIKVYARRWGLKFKK